MWVNATRSGDADAVNYGKFRQVYSNLGKQINRVERKANAGGAAAIVTAGLTQAYIPGKSMMSMSGGTFQGEIVWLLVYPLFQITETGY